MTKDLSIYIHYPFCKSKCPYCDFNSHVREGVDYQRFLSAYEKELEFFAAQIGESRKVKTIFFGGGTPSLMPISLVEGILKKIAALWQVDENCEITLEANPTSSESAKFKDLRDIGINRLSIGIQALNDADLKFLGREHSSEEAIKTIETAAKIFDNFSFDLIYARPQQTLKSWSDELKRAINFGTKHLSLYQLTIEKGTKFFSQFQKKEFEMPSEELSAQFYELTDQITADAGFTAYEISNYARTTPSPLVGFEPEDDSLNGYHRRKGWGEGSHNHSERLHDYRSRHNLVYWQGGDYIGIGAGAHSRIFLNRKKNRSAIMMIHEPLAWLKRVEENGAGIQNHEKISSGELLEELILMGLRLKAGIPNKIFQQFFAKNIEEIFDVKKLQALERQGLISLTNDYIKIIDNVRILTNAIIIKVVNCLL